MLRRSLLALLLCCSLAGCGDDEPKPKFEPRTETTSSTPPPATETSAPGLVEPEMPALAKKHTTAGAEAFTVYYWDVVEYAFTTGDDTGLKELEDPRCDVCETGHDVIRQVHDDGGTVRGGAVTSTVKSSQKATIDGADAYVVSTQQSSTKQVITYPGDRADEVFPASEVRVDTYLFSTPDGWRVPLWERP